MKFKSVTFFGVVSALALSSPAIGRADDTTDLYFQGVLERYFEYSQNARTFGMAGSSVQTSSDSSSVLGNPAGLGFMPEAEFSGSYGISEISGDEFPTGAGVEQDSEGGSGILTLPIGPVLDGLPRFGNFGVAWAASDTNWDDDSFDTISERTQVVAAYSYPVSETVSLGYSFGWIDDKFQSRDIFNYPMGDGYRHTLGAQWRQSSDWTFGTSLHYGYGDHHALFGPGIKTKSETESYGADLGVQYALENNATLAFGADYRHLSSEGDVIASIPANIVGGNENGNIFNLRAGYEHPINDQWALRAGYRYAGLESYKYNRRELNELNGSAAYHAVALGAGVKFPITSKYVRSINLDYGVEYRTAAEGDWQHLVTVSVPFGICS